MGLDGLEPSTSRLSSVRSNQLSYRPKFLLLVLSKLNKVSFAVCFRNWWTSLSISALHPSVFLRKEVIQPQVLLRLPCYDFTPITSFTFGGVLLAVRLPTSGPPGSHGVTGGVYKARERIHRGMLIHDY